MNDQTVVDWGVGRDDDGAGAHGRAADRLHECAGIGQRFDLVGVRAAMDPAPVLNDGANESLDILEDVELPLTRVPQRDTRFERVDWDAADELHV